jgi:hypothetical protein
MNISLMAEICFDFDFILILFYLCEKPIGDCQPNNDERESCDQVLLIGKNIFCKKIIFYIFVDINSLLNFY